MDEDSDDNEHETLFYLSMWLHDAQSNRVRLYSGKCGVPICPPLHLKELQARRSAENWGMRPRLTMSPSSSLTNVTGRGVLAA